MGTCGTEQQQAPEGLGPRHVGDWKTEKMVKTEGEQGEQGCEQGGRIRQGL